MLNLGENSEVLPLRKLSNDEIVDVLHARRLSRATSQHQSSQCQVVLQYDAAVNLGPVSLAFFTLTWQLMTVWNLSPDT